MRPLDHIKQNRNGNTRLLVTIPMEQRIGLAEMSNATETPQQELIRQAIAALLAEFRTAGRDQQAPKTNATAKAQSPVPVMQTTQPEQPPRPSPDHIWVTRGRGGYWRAKRSTRD